MTNDNFGNNRPDSGSTRYTGNSDSYEGAYDAEPIDAEIVDDYSASGADTEYRGAHRRDDDSEYIEDVDYAAGAGAAGAGGARYRSRNADDAIYEEPYDEEPEDRRKAAAAGGAAEGGLPKRGLAMILIAVAALLALWGIWKMTQDGNGGGDDGEGEGAAPTSSTVVGTSQAAPAGDGAGSPAAPAPAGDPNAQNTATVTDTVRADDPNAQDPNAQRPEGAEGQGENGQPAPAPAPAPAGAGLDNASAQVYVYNNSGTPELASRTADQLKGQYNVANNSADAAVMNMPEQVYGIFPETYVFFDPAVPGAEQVAADIARRVGGAARAKGDLPEGATSIPEQAANNSAAVAVVLAG
ncbi:LytR C-terminal domain-containing protein [Corynebacterium afermentans]|nr:LytR C-terminal domain-containing protein [Corynebacterium afermentans]